MLKRSIVWLCAASLLTATSAAGQFVQQGPRLDPFSAAVDWYVGSAVSMSADGNTVVASVFQFDESGGGTTGAYVWSRQGAGWQARTLLLTPSADGGIGSVAISGDGNTIIVGNDRHDGRGAAWVWRRGGGTWVQDGSKLVGAGVDTGAALGFFVALSADGTTALIGAPGQGAAWIWSRQAGVWTQTAKLLPDNRIGPGALGGSVSLSADGNTALVGLAGDNNDSGAAWIWERTDSGWRQGPKLVASTAVGSAHQGSVVALSADGRTAIVGGPYDDNGSGAAWIWARTGAGWSEVAKLAAPARRGEGGSVSLSGDGRIALTGGRGGHGALMWIKNADSWPQHATTLVGLPDSGFGFREQGLAVALSFDGTTAVSTDSGFEGREGALWIFSAAPTALPGSDMDGDGVSDVAVWQPLTGRWKWQTAATGFDGARAGSKSWGRGDWGDVPITGDVDGDHIDDLIVYRSTTGVWNWLTSSSGFTRSDSKAWGVPSLGDRPILADLDGDRIDDFIVWRPATGVWYSLKSRTGYDATKAGSVAWGSGSLGDIPLTGDFDGDGRADIAVWRPTDNTFYWLNSSTLTGGSKQWGVSAVGDIPLVANIDGDHRADLAVWRPGDGTFYWVLSSKAYSSSAAGSAQWGVAEAGDTPSLADMDGDGKADLIVWRATTSEWFWLKSSAGYSRSTAGYAR